MMSSEDMPFVTRISPGNARGLTVEQMKNYLEDMPDRAIIVVEGGRLIDPHILTNVLPPEGDENTVMLAIGGKYAAPEEVADA